MLVKPPEFVAEHQIYALLEKCGIQVPKHQLLSTKSPIASGLFSQGEPIVVKAIAENLWHKSDAGGLKFGFYNEGEVISLVSNMQQVIEKDYHWIGALVTEKVDFEQPSGLPSELFLSVQRDKCCGAIVTLGIGGVLTEMWASQMHQSLLVWPTSVYSSKDAFEELSSHFIGQLLLGKLRGSSPLVSSDRLQHLIETIWTIEDEMQAQQIGLLEVNPLVISKGEFIALDGVGTRLDGDHMEGCPIPINDQTLINPKSLAIAGVSLKKVSVGNMIFENVKQSLLPKSQITLIKPHQQSIDGYQCVPDIEALQSNPVDILILALPAESSVDSIRQLCEQGSGAEIVYIVAGGIGDSADQHGYSAQIEDLINDRRERGLWCPALVGPNGLGMIVSPLLLNSLFIPQTKLNINFDSDSHVALISQSGAFLITRLSRHSNLSLKYGFSIGNQLDLKLSDFMALMYRDKSIKVLGIYAEGFIGSDVCAVAQLVKQFKQDGRHVIIYKGGRSILGQEAAAGHTGAMTGDYLVQKRLLSKAGASMVETFNQFNAVFKWMTAYPETNSIGELAIITNAGYETVSSVDIIGDSNPVSLVQLKSEQQSALDRTLQNCQLGGLVSASNPLDLTPMANEDAYFQCAMQLQSFGAKVILIGLVPLSDNLDTQELTRTKKFAQQLAELAKRNKVLIGVVVDAGIPYQEYKSVFEDQHLPVFEGMDIAVLGINVLHKQLQQK